MPGITATLGLTTVTGLNANARPAGDNAPPSVAITARAAALATIMNGLNNQGRSAYACAEAQALAKLLLAVNPPVAYGDIEFSCANAQGGLELWPLCANCAGWLTQKNGFGATKKFRLSDAALLALNPPPAQAVPANDNANFPGLPVAPRRVFNG
jgi:hypothetical protein